MIATGLDGMYRAADVDSELTEQMFIQAIMSVARVARVHDAPVIVTRCREDDFSTPLRRAAVMYFQCQETAFGPRFDSASGDTETLVYPTEDGWMQTTLAYWREALEYRARIHENGDIEGMPATLGL